MKFRKEHFKLKLEKDKNAIIIRYSEQFVQALEEKMRAATEKQFALFLSDRVDEVAVMMVIDEMSEVNKEIAKAKAREILSIKSVLTPEQLSKLPAVLLERQKSKRPAPRK